MTHSCLILTNKAIKNHSKRLQKELNKQQYLIPISLGQSQQLFSKALGFNNFYSLQQALQDNHDFNFTYYEKAISILCCLIIDGEKELALNIIKDFNRHPEKIKSQSIENLFQQYRADIISIHHQKEMIILRLFAKARQIMPLPSSYFLFIRSSQEKNLWELLFLSGRSLRCVHNKKTYQTFKQYHYIFN